MGFTNANALFFTMGICNQRSGLAVIPCLSHVAYWQRSTWKWPERAILWTRLSLRPRGPILRSLNAYMGVQSEAEADVCWYVSMQCPDLTQCDAWFWSNEIWSVFILAWVSIGLASFKPDTRESAFILFKKKKKSVIDWWLLLSIFHPSIHPSGSYLSRSAAPWPGTYPQEHRLGTPWLGYHYIRTYTIIHQREVECEGGPAAGSSCGLGRTSTSVLPMHREFWDGSTAHGVNRRIII